MDPIGLRGIFPVSILADASHRIVVLTAVGGMTGGREDEGGPVEIGAGKGGGT